MQEILTIRDLCKSFDSLSVLEHIDLTIKKGEAIGQGVFSKYLVTDDDVAGGDRTGGFGSTDKK